MQPRIEKTVGIICPKGVDCGCIQSANRRGEKVCYEKHEAEMAKPGKDYTFLVETNRPEFYLDNPNLKVESD